MRCTRKHPIMKLFRGKKEKIEDTLVTESPLRVFIDGVKVATIVCTPHAIEYLAAGFAYSEHFIQSKNDISGIHCDQKRGIVSMITCRHTPTATAQKDDLSRTGPGAGKNSSTSDRARANNPGIASPPDTPYIDWGCFSPHNWNHCTEPPFTKAGPLKTSPEIPRNCTEVQMQVQWEEVTGLVKQAHALSSVYRSTGGVHSAGVCTSSEVVAFYEDIGRHNAVDKVLGRCIVEGIPLHDKLLITSGRVSRTVMLKAINAGIPIIVSVSAPTFEAVTLASACGVTLVGFARGRRMNIYTCSYRIKTN
ncbi:MAG: formate dehydrogenase accessory sulfurtransferase FdhD [Spirochaetota bacterium]